MRKWFTWTAFAAAFWFCVTASAHASDKAPAAVGAEFTDFMKKFDSALKANDAEAVARLSQLPFQGNAAVSTTEQFIAAIYEDSFSTRNRACIRRGHAVYNRDQENNDSYAIFCGQLIFTFTRTPGGFLFTDVDMND